MSNVFGTWPSLFKERLPKKREVDPDPEAGFLDSCQSIRAIRTYSETPPAKTACDGQELSEGEEVIADAQSSKDNLPVS